MNRIKTSINSLGTITTCLPPQEEEALTYGPEYPCNRKKPIPWTFPPMDCLSSGSMDKMTLKFYSMANQMDN